MLITTNLNELHIFKKVFVVNTIFLDIRKSRIIAIDGDLNGGSLLVKIKLLDYNNKKDTINIGDLPPCSVDATIIKSHLIDSTKLESFTNLYNSESVEQFKLLQLSNDFYTEFIFTNLEDAINFLKLYVENSNNNRLKQISDSINAIKP